MQQLYLLSVYMRDVKMDDISESKKKTCIFANLSIALLVSSNTFILDLKTKKFKKYPGEYDMFDITVADNRGDLSFDKKKILVVSKENDNLEIFSMNPDGTNRINLTNNPALDSSPYWQPAP